MAERARAFDWSTTPLGPISGWPSSLRTAVSICLNSRFPMFVWWGPDLINIYNDAYIPVLGKRHPSALGAPAAEIWGEIWSVVGPQAEAVMQRGEATWNERVLLVMERHGFREDTWFTWSYSPIRDVSGNVAGLFCACTEETGRILAERERDRLAVQRQRADERARTILQSITDAFMALDRNWRFTFVNAQTERVLGRASAELLGRVIWEVYPGLLDSAFERAYRHTMDEGVPESLTAYYPDHDRWYEVRVYPSPDGISIYLRDETERKRDEERLREQERRQAFLLALGDAIRGLTDPVAVMATATERLGRHLGVARVGYAEIDPEQTTVSVERDWTNGTMASLAGERRPINIFGPRILEELRAGRTLRLDDIASDPRSAAYAAGYESIGTRALLIVPLTKGDRLTAILYLHEPEPRRWTDEDAALVEEVAERTWAAAETARAQTALRESEARFRAMADSAPVLLWMSGLDRRCYWFNKPWLEFTGRTMEQEYGNGWVEGVHPDDVERCVQTYTDCFDRHVPFQMDYRLRRYDGEYRWILDHGVPLLGPGGVFTGFIGSCIDITERKRIEEERQAILESERAARAESERLNRMKDEFLATLSHELRTPLNAIYGWAQVLLRSEGELAPTLRQGLETIERNARAQTQIIEDLLDMSRIISGKVRLDVQRVPLAPVIEAAVETVRHAADAKGVRLQSVIDPNAGPVSGDPQRLQQVLWNLLHNAIKFTPRGGRVQVLLERVNSHVEVSVVDSGEGIAPEFLPHVFDRFRQADASTVRRHGGLGLGLAIVKHLVELHGGTVRVKSTGLGQGSTFAVALPLAPLHADTDTEAERRHPTAAAMPRVMPEVSANIAGVRVLVVDDEPDARELVRRLLLDRGASVVAAGSADEAVDLLRRNPPDVLVSDIGMPGEDGYSLLRRVRALGRDEGRDTPAVALTAYARAEDRVRSVLAGFQMHIAKPVEPAELIATVASLAGRT